MRRRSLPGLACSPVSRATTGASDAGCARPGGVVAVARWGCGSPNRPGGGQVRSGAWAPRHSQVPLMSNELAGQVQYCTSVLCLFPRAMMTDQPQRLCWCWARGAASSLAPGTLPLMALGYTYMLQEPLLG